MATRSERLNRLATGFSCEASWEEMAGQGCRRHCVACRRDVLDFAQLTPREIAAHVAASRGQLCGRLTRRGGGLVMAPAIADPTPSSPGQRRRASALAATLVSAWLAAGAGSSRAGEAPRAEAAAEGDSAERVPRPQQADATNPGAVLRGRVNDPTGEPLGDVLVVVNNTLAGSAYSALTLEDGSFAFDGLPLGTYDLQASRGGFAIEVTDRIVLRAGVQMNVEITATPPLENVTMGAVIAVAEPLRRLVADSDLVVVAVAGPSFVAARDGDLATAATELRVETVVKGPAELRRVSFRHYEYPDLEDGAVDAAGELVAGTRVLAFLDRSEDGATDGRAPAYEAVDYQSMRLLSEAEIAAYESRLEALQRVEARATRRGERDPEELVEWLVATAEEPLTRGEATGELAQALDALAEHAEASSLTTAQAAADLIDLVDRFHGEGGRLQAEPQPALLGAFLGEGQRERLTAALVATREMRRADRELFALVRRWDEPAAMAWLAEQLDRPVEADDRDEDDAEELHYWLQGLVEEIGDTSLAALVEASGAREEEIEALWPEDETEKTQALRAERLEEVRASLRHEVAAALAARQ